MSDKARDLPIAIVSLVFLQVCVLPMIDTRQSPAWRLVMLHASLLKLGILGEWKCSYCLVDLVLFDILNVFTLTEILSKSFMKNTGNSMEVVTQIDGRERC